MENDLESVWFVLEVYACAFFCDEKDEEKRERQREVSAQKHQHRIHPSFHADSDTQKKFGKRKNEK